MSAPPVSPDLMAALDFPDALQDVQDAYWERQREWQVLDEAYRRVVADMLARVPKDAA